MVTATGTTAATPHSGVTATVTGTQLVTALEMTAAPAMRIVTAAMATALAMAKTQDMATLAATPHTTVTTTAGMGAPQVIYSGLLT